MCEESRRDFHVLNMNVKKTFWGIVLYVSLLDASHIFMKMAMKIMKIYEES